MEKDQEPKILQDDDKFLMYSVSKFYPQIHYILGDMFPPNQGSSLSHDSFLNMTPRENCYMSGYEGPNELSQDFIDREWNIIFVVKFSDPDDETGKCGSPYMFAMLNNPEASHHGKLS